jgi:hypothetical protein
MCQLIKTGCMVYRTIPRLVFLEQKNECVKTTVYEGVFAKSYVRVGIDIRASVLSAFAEAHVPRRTVTGRML